MRWITLVGSRRLGLVAALGLGALLAGCGDVTTTPVDARPPGTDADPSGIDAAPPGIDAEPPVGESRWDQSQWDGPQALWGT
jgi:hypothetical protein